jgi:hypothetical protein
MLTYVLRIAVLTSTNTLKAETRLGFYYISMVVLVYFFTGVSHGRLRNAGMSC